VRGDVILMTSSGPKKTTSGISFFLEKETKCEPLEPLIDFLALVDGRLWTKNHKLIS